MYNGARDSLFIIVRIYVNNLNLKDIRLKNNIEIIGHDKR